LDVDWYAMGRPGRSELMYIAHCTCRKSQCSTITLAGCPPSSALRTRLLVSMIVCARRRARVG